MENDRMNKIAEASINMLLVALKSATPVPERLANYLKKCEPDEVHRYFMEYQNFDPLIVHVNEKMYCFDIKHFTDCGDSPLFQQTTLKLNSI